MRRTQLIALLLVVIMAVATIPAIAATEVQSAPAAQQTPTVTAYRYPTLSAISVPTYPHRYQTFTIYGWLKWSGTPLPNKYAKVYYKWPGQSTWHYLKSVKTNVNGRYSFSSATGAAAINWMIKFAGDSVYYQKTCYITVHTKISQCKHVDVIVYFPYNTPCSMCIVRKYALIDFANKHKPYVTVTTQTVPSDLMFHRVKCTVRETGQFAYFDDGGTDAAIAWVNGHLGC